jgi:dipeptidyl-peptidase III
MTDGIKYNDIRQECGFKNVMIANQISSREDSKSSPRQASKASPFLENQDIAGYRKHESHATYLWIVFHELMGHGTGRMMVQEDGEIYNFDVTMPPVDPLTGTPITSWYRPGQTWTGQFTDLATTVDECRTELVGAYLMDDKDILALFGYNDQSDILADDRQSFR